MSKINIMLCTGLAVLIAVTAVSCKKNPKEYEVSGQLENVTGTYFFMSHQLGDSVFIDTVNIDSKGKFSFKGEIDTLTEFSLYFNQNTKSTFILADKGWEVKLKGDVLYPDLIDIRGGDVNNDLTEFKEKNKELLRSRSDIMNAAEKDDSDNDSLPVKDYVVELKNINFELSNVAANYVKSNPDKIASVMLINTFFKDQTSIPRLDENLALLKGKAVDFPLTADLKKFRDKVKLSAVGAYAPGFSQKNISGKTVQLADFRGKYVLLLFASTTCQVCKQEKRDAIEVYTKLKKDKVNIEFISIIKDSEQEALPANIKDSVKWEILPVNGGWAAKLFDTYYIREIPYNILITPTGSILVRDLPVHSVISKMEELTATEPKNRNSRP